MRERCFTCTLGIRCDEVYLLCTLRASFDKVYLMCTLRARCRLEFACTHVSRVSIFMGKYQLPGLNMQFNRHQVLWLGYACLSDLYSGGRGRQKNVQEFRVILFDLYQFGKLVHLKALREGNICDKLGPTFIFQMKCKQTEMELVNLVSRSDASSDVPLVSGDASLCKHFKFGYCKFGEKCQKRHLKETCQTSDCNSKNCNKRHPKICKFFSLNQVCKFGDACCYKHKLNATHSSLLEEISVLHAMISSMKDFIQALEDDILRLKSPLPSPERERSILREDSLNVSLADEDREEITSFPDSPAATEQIVCEFQFCHYVSHTKSDMSVHIAESHTITSSFIYPDRGQSVVCEYDKGIQIRGVESEECEAFLHSDQAYAMHVYQEHKI